MGIGSAEEELLLRVSTPIALNRVKAALGEIGKVLESDDVHLFVRGTTRFGLQKVRIKCQVVASGESSRVVIKTLGDDVWGKGAREGIKKMKSAMGNL